MRFMVLKQQHPCYVPLRFVASYDKKRIYATIPVTTCYPISSDDFKQLYSDGEPIDKKSKEVDVKIASEFVKGIMTAIEHIIARVIEEKRWEDFTSKDLKGILEVLAFESLTSSFDLNYESKYISQVSIWLMNKGRIG